MLPTVREVLTQLFGYFGGQELDLISGDQRSQVLLERNTNLR